MLARMTRIAAYLACVVSWSLASLPIGLSRYIDAHPRVVIDFKSAKNSELKFVLEQMI
jgi:hypothetical protein